MNGEIVYKLREKKTGRWVIETKYMSTVRLGGHIFKRPFELDRDDSRRFENVKFVLREIKKGDDNG